MKVFKKFIGFAFENSPIATSNGFSETGCWYFSMQTDDPKEEQIKMCSKSQEEVISHSCLYVGKWERYSQYIPPLKMEETSAVRTVENMPDEWKKVLRSLSTENTRAAFLLHWLEDIPLPLALKRIGNFRREQRWKAVQQQVEEEIASNLQQKAMEEDRKQREIQEIWDGFSSAKTIEDMRTIIGAIIIKLWGPKP